MCTPKDVLDPSVDGQISYLCGRHDCSLLHFGDPVIGTVYDDRILVSSGQWWPLPRGAAPRGTPGGRSPGSARRWRAGCGRETRRGPGRGTPGAAGRAGRGGASPARCRGGGRAVREAVGPEAGGAPPPVARARGAALRRPARRGAGALAAARGRGGTRGT